MLNPPCKPSHQCHGVRTEPLSLLMPLGCSWDRLLCANGSEPQTPSWQQTLLAAAGVDGPSPTSAAWPGSNAVAPAQLNTQHGAVVLLGLGRLTRGSGRCWCQSSTEWPLEWALGLPPRTWPCSHVATAPMACKPASQPAAHPHGLQGSQPARNPMSPMTLALQKSSRTAHWGALGRSRHPRAPNPKPNTWPLPDLRHRARQLHRAALLAQPLCDAQP